VARVRAGPEAEAHRPVALATDGASERHVELLLDPGIVGVDLREAVERTVSGPVSQGGRHRAIAGQVGAEGPEPLHDLPTVGVEDGVGIDRARISAGVEQQIEEIPAPVTKDEIEWRAGLEARAAAAGEQEMDQVVLTALDGDLQCGRPGSSPARDGVDLKGPAGLDPRSDVREAPRPAGRDEVAELLLATGERSLRTVARELRSQPGVDPAFQGKLPPSATARASRSSKDRRLIRC
jgi:hypothetical protein